MSASAMTSSQRPTMALRAVSETTISGVIAIYSHLCSHPETAVRNKAQRRNVPLSAWLPQSERTAGVAPDGSPCKTLPSADPSGIADRCGRWTTVKLIEACEPPAKKWGPDKEKLAA